MKQKVKSIFAHADGINPNHRKDGKLYESWAVVGYSRGKGIKEVAALRIYATPARMYACIWLHSEPYASGSGWVDGAGYHLPSAAASNAMKDAGIHLSESIYGRGIDAIREAMEAIARYYGYSIYHVVHAHA